MRDEGSSGLEMVLKPVGVVRSEIKAPVLQAGKEGLELRERMSKLREYHRKVKEMVSELRIHEEWEGILDGIEGFSHLMVLYWPHLVDPERRGLRRVHPMGRKDLPRQGIFATCSPARPNPVLVTTVELLGRDGSVLRVKGLEAVDGSPVVDIKPFVKGYHGAESPRVPDWMARIHRELEDGDGEEAPGPDGSK